MKNVPGYEQALKETDSIKKEFVEEINKSKETLNKKVEAIFKNYSFKQDATYEEVFAKLSEQDKKKMELLQEESKLLDKQGKAKEEEYQEIYQNKVGKIIEMVNQKVQEYCKKNKIDILYKLDQLQPAIAYYDLTKDRTDNIIALVSK